MQVLLTTLDPLWQVKQEEGSFSLQVRQGNLHLITHFPLVSGLYPLMQTAQRLSLHSKHLLSEHSTQASLISYRPCPQPVHFVMSVAEQDVHLVEQPMHWLSAVRVNPFTQVRQTEDEEQL